MESDLSESDRITRVLNAGEGTAQWWCGLWEIAAAMLGRAYGAWKGGRG